MTLIKSRSSSLCLVEEVHDQIREAGDASGSAELIDQLKSKQVELSSALESKQVQLEAAIADSKVQAAKELGDVKVALEESQDKAKVSLAQELDKLAQRAKKGEDNQVGLAKKLELKQTLSKNPEFQQFQQSWLKRCTDIDNLLAQFEASMTAFIDLCGLCMTVVVLN